MHQRWTQSLLLLQRLLLMVERELRILLPLEQLRTRWRCLRKCKTKRIVRRAWCWLDVEV